MFRCNSSPMSYCVFKKHYLEEGSVGFNELTKGPWCVKDPHTERFEDCLSSLRGTIHIFAHSVHQCLWRAFCALDIGLGPGDSTVKRII